MRITDLIKIQNCFIFLPQNPVFSIFFLRDFLLIINYLTLKNITFISHFLPIIFPQCSFRLLLPPRRCSATSLHAHFIYVAPSGAGNVPSACFRFASACCCLHDVAVQRLYMHKFIYVTPSGAGIPISPTKKF